MKRVKAGDLWGGLASMLVALPQSIAFGIIVFSPLGLEYVSLGALAGTIGAITMGIISPLMGGTPGLISSPCAPSAAFLAGLLGESWLRGMAKSNPEAVILVIGMTVFFAGIFQVFFSLLGGGKIIKYIPYPVVTGYLSSVGIIIFIGQFPRLTGLDPDLTLWQTLSSMERWSVPALVTGLVTIAVMYTGPKLSKKIPAPVIGLAGGIVVYFLLSVHYPFLLSFEDNSFVVGKLQGDFSPSRFIKRFDSVSQLDFALIKESIIAGATLAIVLSIDTLKTCVIADSINRSRSNSNKELFGQGLGNLVTGVMGGIAGAGTLGATLVNLSSGAVSRFSGAFAGLFSLFAFAALSQLIAWIPVSALAGILILIAVRTIDWNILTMFGRKAAIFDFLVICGVIITALKFSLMAAAGTGFVLSTIFFLREQIMGSVIRRKNYGDKIFSKRSRLSQERKILSEEGHSTIIYELQGNLFFGNTDRFFTNILEDMESGRFIILNLRMVQTIDSTAVHLFDQVNDLLSEKKGRLILAGVPMSIKGSKDLENFLHEVGLPIHSSSILLFEDLYEALEWVEDYILSEKEMYHSHMESPVDIDQIEIFRNLSPGRIKKIKRCLEKRSFAENQKIFSSGDSGDELYFIRKGVVKIFLRMDPRFPQKVHHLATFGRGDFFGDMAFVDREPRSADAIAATETDLYVLSRKKFESVVHNDPSVGKEFYENLVKVLAMRFRSTHLELRSLE
jgi:SulP family sulfate permease